MKINNYICKSVQYSSCKSWVLYDLVQIWFIFSSWQKQEIGNCRFCCVDCLEGFCLHKKIGKYVPYSSFKNCVLNDLIQVLFIFSYGSNKSYEIAGFVAETLVTFLPSRARFQLVTEPSWRKIRRGRASSKVHCDPSS